MKCSALLSDAKSRAIFAHCGRLLSKCRARPDSELERFEVERFEVERFEVERFEVERFEVERFDTLELDVRLGIRIRNPLVLFRRVSCLGAISTLGDERLRV